jgi:hypothetical protein
LLLWGSAYVLVIVNAMAGGMAGNAFGIRNGMVLMGPLGCVGVVVAWTSPLRRIAAGHDAQAV